MFSLCFCIHFDYRLSLFRISVATFYSTFYIHSISFRFDLVLLQTVQSGFVAQYASASNFSHKLPCHLIKSNFHHYLVKRFSWISLKFLQIIHFYIRVFDERQRCKKIFFGFLGLPPIPIITKREFQFSQKSFGSFQSDLRMPKKICHLLLAIQICICTQRLLVYLFFGG